MTTSTEGRAYEVKPGQIDRYHRTAANFQPLLRTAVVVSPLTLLLWLTVTKSPSYLHPGLGDGPREDVASPLLSGADAQSDAARGTGKEASVMILACKKLRRDVDPVVLRESTCEYK
jgi:hypothetical protein